MMMRQKWAEEGLPNDAFKGAMPISGAFEPEAILHTSINDDVGLDADTARRNGLLDSPPIVAAPVLALVGGDEPEGFHALSKAYVALCGKGEKVSVASANHFTVLDHIFQKDGDHFAAMMAQIN